MWRAASGRDESMVLIEGLTGAESLKVLEPAYKTLISDPERFKELNPSNGWGSYEGLCSFLEKAIAAAKKWPNDKWEAWR